MAFKQRSSGTFKMMGSSPVQKHFNKTGGKTTTPGYSTTKAAKSNVKANTHMKVDFNLENKKALNQKFIAKVNKKPTSTLGRITKTFKNTPKQFAKGGKEILKTTNRNLVSGGKQILKKGAKFLGGKALGVASMMMATSSKADQPTYKSTGDPNYKKGESQQIKDLLTKHKLKGGRN